MRSPGSTLQEEADRGLLERFIRLRRAPNPLRQREQLIQVPNKVLRTARIRAPSKSLLGLQIRVRNKALYTLPIRTRLDLMAGKAQLQDLAVQDLAVQDPAV
ncbi:MAG TPA: hypothetical protein VGM27_04255 [Acidobacteriaceae bacterium]